MMLDGWKRAVPSYYRANDTRLAEIIEPEDGNNVVITIDADIRNLRSKIEEFNTMTRVK